MPAFGEKRRKRNERQPLVTGAPVRCRCPVVAVVECAVAQQLEIPAFCGGHVPPAALQPVNESVAFGLVEGRKLGEVDSAGLTVQKGGNARLEGAPVENTSYW